MPHPALDFTRNRISGSKWPAEKAGRAVGRDSQIFDRQLAKINGPKWPFEGSQGGTPCPVIWCCASYPTGYYLAQNGGRFSSFAAARSPGKLLKWKKPPLTLIPKSGKSNRNRFTYGANNRPTKPTTLVISGAIIIAEIQYLSDFSKRKNSDTTRIRNDASYFHRKLGTLSSCSSMSFSVILSVGFKWR